MIKSAPTHHEFISTPDQLLDCLIRRWINLLRSTLWVKRTWRNGDHGYFSGLYQSPKVGFSDGWYDVLGLIDVGDVAAHRRFSLSFSVLWRNGGRRDTPSLCNWIGFFLPHEEKIVTKSTLAISPTNSLIENANSVFTPLSTQALKFDEGER